MGTSRHVVILGLVIACALVMFPGSAGATLYVVYKGSLTGGEGLTAYDGWSDATLSWEVKWDSTNALWGYSYTFSPSPLSKDVSHFLIETSDTFTKEDNLKEWKTGSNEPVVGEWTPTSDGKSNPHLPSSLYGIKFETDGYADRNSVWFWTDRSPVWGDWYAKDGKDAGVDAAAYNRGFGQDPFETPPDDAFEDWCWEPTKPGTGQWGDGVPDGWVLNDTWNYVLRPDTIISDDPGGGGFEIPEPNIGLLLLLGIIPVGIGVRRRRARKQS